MRILLVLWSYNKTQVQGFVNLVEFVTIALFKEHLSG